MSSDESWVHRIGLGTAQFGLAYGISNQSGRVDDAEAARILRRAVEAGIGVVDTAPAYGDAERVVAAGLPAQASVPVVTKTLRLAEGLDRVVARARESRALLGRAPDLIVHSAGDLAGAPGDDLWAALRELRAEGICRRIGFSAYVEDDVLALAGRFRPEIVQVPCSLADQRLVMDGTLARLAASGVDIHIRSIFLQGLLLMEPGKLPGGLARVAPWLDATRRKAAGLGLSMLEASLGFAASLPGHAMLILGVTGMREFEDILAIASRSLLPDADWPGWRLNDEAALSPARWKELGA